jgi:hypothetical protein
MVDRRPTSLGNRSCFFCEQRRTKPRTLLSHPLIAKFAEADRVSFVGLFT